jgi:hypothetical protein
MRRFGGGRVVLRGGGKEMLLETWQGGSGASEAL